jgi:hypothetical protein
LTDSGDAPVAPSLSHTSGDAKAGISDHQGVQTRAEIGNQERQEAVVDLSCRGGSRGRDSSHQAVRAGANDLLGLQMVERLAEQHRLGVVLQRPRHEPIAEPTPRAGPAGAPPRPRDHRLSVLATRSVADKLHVARQLIRGHRDPLGQTLDDLRRGGRELGGDEPEKRQRAQLNRQAKAVRCRAGGAEGPDPPHVLDRQREERSEVAARDLGGPAGELLNLPIGQDPARHARSDPRPRRRC